MNLFIPPPALRHLRKVRRTLSPAPAARADGPDHSPIDSSIVATSFVGTLQAKLRQT